MIKIISTSKFEGLAVLVPDDARNFAIGRWAGRSLVFNQGHYEVDNIRTGKIELDSKSEYEILGKATELTEKQCQTIIPLPAISARYGDRYQYCPAKETFADLMKEMECYSVNPYSKDKPIEVGGYFGGDPAVRNIVSDQHLRLQMWQEAQANTGTWLILKKL